MTRETKIGLLVGLAFIIVIGILLSDHMTSTTEPPKAPLSMAGNNVRESIAAPVSHSAAAAVGQTGPVTPNQTVMVGADLAQPRPAAPQAIQVGPGVESPVVITTVPGQVPVHISPGQPTQGQAVQGLAMQDQGSQPPVTVVAPGALDHESPVIITPPAADTNRAGSTLAEVAARHGEALVDAAAPRGAAAGRQPVPMAPLREYQARNDDTLSKLAGRFLGGNTKANRDAIIRVNPTLQQNPDRVVAGRTYLIPLASAAVVDDGPSGAAAAARSSPENTAPPAGVPAASESFRWYTVKENDNLWKIASDQLGTGNAWTTLRDLNPDVLKGGDNVKPNMRIRIPNKPVASAN